MAKGEHGESHPSATELERFLLGDMSPRQAGPIIAHLLPGCAECRQRMGPLSSVMFANGPLALDAAPTASADYDFPIFRALATARRYAATQTKPKSLRPVPVAPPPHEVPSAIETMAGSRLRARCESLLEQARALRFHDLEGMLLAAFMAVGIAERMTPDQTPAADLADFQSRAWAELGNAYRVADDLASAETALARALERLGQGTGDPLLLARLMDLTASLYVDQRRFREARVLLDCVHRIYEHEGDTHAAARALVSKGVCANYALDSEEALGFLSEGVRRMDPARDPKLALAAVHGLLWCLVDTGRASVARTLLPDARALYDTHGEHFDKLKGLWLEGRIAAGLGEDEIAESAFTSVRQGYQEADLAYDAALVSLDLAAIWLHQGRTAEIMEMVDEMITIFQARGIQREALAALLMLRNALETDRATASLLRHVMAELWRLERIPTRGRVPA
jgi:tetratricopeptide (TPR) repeat protein